MKWKNVLTEHGKYDRKYIENRLNELGSRLFDNWEFVDSTRGATITDDGYFVTGHKDDRFPRVLIGGRHLTFGCGPDEMNRAAYVKAVNQMFHEYRHTTQRAMAFMEDLPDSRMEDIVRRQFVRIFYGTIYDDSYLTDPGETDVILYSLKETLDYFESDPVITKQEAGDILFGYMTADDSRVRDTVLGPYAPESIYDVISAYERINDVACDVKYDFNPGIFGEEWDMTDEFIWCPDYERERDAFENAATGREQDRILEGTIVLAHPDVMERIPALKKELYMLLRQYHEDFTESIDSISVPVGSLDM